MTTQTKDLPPVPDPVGWLTRFVNRSGLNCQVLCNHNSVGDYRDIDPGATSERVYSESQMHAYALEAIRASATSAPDAVFYQHTDGRIGQPSSAMLARGVPMPPEWTVMQQPDQSAGAGKVMQPLKAERVKELYPEARRKWNEISDHWNSWGQLPDDEKAELICRETELAHGIQPEQPQLAGDK